MKSAHDSPILVPQTVRLAFEDDTTVEAFSVLASLTEIEALLKGTWEPNICFDLQISPAIPVVTCSRWPSKRYHEPAVQCARRNAEERRDLTCCCSYL